MKNVFKILVFVLTVMSMVQAVASSSNQGKGAMTGIKGAIRSRGPTI